MQENNVLTVRGLLVFALAGAICIRIAARSETGDRADAGSQPASEQIFSKPESLKQAWSVAIASAHRTKPSGADTEPFSGLRAALFPIAAAGAPRSTANAEYSSVRSLPVMMGVPAAQDDQFWAGRTVFTVPIFASERVLSGVEAVRYRWRAARAEERRATLDLKLRVAEAYVSMLRAAREASAASNLTVTLAFHLQTALSLRDKGLVAPGEMPVAQSALNKARQIEMQTRANLDIARARYNRVLIRPPAHPVTIMDLEPPSPPGRLSAMMSDALRERPELDILAEQAESMRQEAMTLRARTRPSVGLSGDYNHLAAGFLERDQALTSGVVVSWKLFERASTLHKALEADIKAGECSALLAEAMGGVSSQVRQAALALDEVILRLDAASGALVRAGRELTSARERFRAGAGASGEVLDAHTLHSRALGNRDNAFYDTVMGGFNLRRAIGDL